MATTITYNGEIITEFDSGTKTLKTYNKKCLTDIVVESSGGGNQPTCFPAIVTETDTQVSWTENTDNGDFNITTVGTIDGVTVTSPISKVGTYQGKTLIITVSSPDDTFIPAITTVDLIPTLQRPSIALVSGSDTEITITQISNADNVNIYADNTQIGTVSVGGQSTLTVDVSELSGWGDLPDAMYRITAKNTASGWYDSVSSNAVDIGKGTIVPDAVLNNNAWATISLYDDTGANYWSVGDVKQVHLEGTMGTLSLNTDLYVFILGFNHIPIIQGDGITFGCFKDSSGADAKDLAIIDTHYDGNSTDGSKWFNANHWGNYNYGGWSGCDLRYDILGSTDVAPSDYGSAVTTNRVGYNATSTCATNPVSNTLMSCLPLDLRVVMKPMNIFTDNKGNASNIYDNVTASTDYLPLLAEYEIFGTRTYANQYEDIYQNQYAYYSAGNSKVKYQHSSTGSAASWLGRSPNRNNRSQFCSVSSGNVSRFAASWDVGIAPIFLV